MNNEIQGQGSIPSVPQTPKVYRFVVTGKALRQSIRKLKPAFPKKKDPALLTVVISASRDKVTFAIVGASVDIPVQANGTFTAEIPFVEFKMIMSDPFKDNEQLTFEFSPGSLTFRGVTTRMPSIRVRKGLANAGSFSPPSTWPSFVNPADAPIGLPLLGAYAYIRKYGFQPTCHNPNFVQQQVDVENILDKADKLLRPLGLSRADLEMVLDKRLGLLNENKT